MLKGENHPYLQYMYSYPHKTAYGELKGVNFADYAPELRGRENSLYIHIPFCQYKCGYCNLFSIAGADRGIMEAYVGQIEKQAGQIAGVLENAPGADSQIEFKDLTIGGGTPLILDAYLLKRILETAGKYFHFDMKENPVIIETSPNQTTREKLELLKEEGVKRISIGVESFIDEELKNLKRLHSEKAAHRALEEIKRAGFDCLNIDVIYGIPGQTKESLLESLSKALYYDPEEMFVYPLYVKPETCLYKEGVTPAENMEELYRCGKDFLESRGYIRKSMRRFERKRSADSGPCGVSNAMRRLERERSADSGLCGFSNTIALGCGGRSYMGNLHFCTPYAVGQDKCHKIISGYLKQKDFLNIGHGYILNDDEQRRRYAVKHLLYDRGINRGDYREHFKGEAEEDFPMLKEWEKKEYVVFSEDYISLTDRGMDLSDYLGPAFISDEVANRMERF